MAVYAVGDIQGCDRALASLLARLRYKPGADCLWFVGDLVNRGPHSAEVLRRVMDLGDNGARVVLGNHDLHLLALSRGAVAPRKKDNAVEVLDQPDAPALLDWLRRRPMLIRDMDLGMVMAHAGIEPAWTDAELGERAAEVERCITDDGSFDEYLKNMYGALPDRWSEHLTGWDRLRLITNILTRMRYRRRDGSIDLAEKAGPGKVTDPGLRPWYHELGDDRPYRVVFGHWSTLGLVVNERVIALDTGCVWGGSLTAIRLDDPALPVFAVECG